MSFWLRRRSRTARVGFRVAAAPRAVAILDLVSRIARASCRRGRAGLNKCNAMLRAAFADAGSFNLRDEILWTGLG